MNQQTSNPVFKFLKETFNRLFTGESPHFFRILKTLGAIATALMGIPAALVAWQSQFNITLPEWLLSYGNNAYVIGAGVIGVTTWINSQMVKKTVTADKMPLTKPTE